MRSNIRLCAALAAALSACGETGEAGPGPVFMAADSAVLGMGNLDASVPINNNPGTAGGTAGGLTGGAIPGATTGGASGTAGAGPLDAGGGPMPGGGGMPGGGMSQDAGPSNDASAPPVLTVPTSSVDCGGSACNALTNVCCEAWSIGTGFSGQQMCATRDACRQAYPFDVFNPDANRVVTHMCDGKEDCAAGQVCCFYMEGRPICDAIDPAMCFANLMGPGAGRICAEEAKCQQGAFEFVGEGLPLGVLSCNDDGDCQARPGTSCQPEPDGSLTTGTSIKARAHVKVCR
jgi:hypothetical protein